MSTRRLLTKLAAATLVAVIALSAVPQASGQRPSGPRGTDPACPENITASASEDGILLEWDHHLPPGSRDFQPPPESEFRVYRAPADEVDEAAIEHVPDDARFELVATLDADTVEEFLDTDAREEGESFAYVVTFFDGVESQDCPVIEATAIPFFGAPPLALAAALGCAGTYLLLRRK